MFFFRSQVTEACLLCIFVVCLTAAVIRSQSLPQVSPGQNLPTTKAVQIKPGQTQAGKVDSSQSTPVQTVQPDNSQSPAGPVNQDANQAQGPPIVFESHGLEYDAITRNGVTVMLAQLPSRLKDFNIVQITVTNGALLSWTVRPSDFSFVKPDGAVASPVSADEVVEELLQRADRDDVIKLQLLYENSIYGLSNFRSTNGYEKRREAAMAQFVNRGLKAAVEASAIAFVATKLKPGDSTDGAVFFENKTKEKSLGPGRIAAHTCGETFIFETYAELKKH